MSPRYADNCGVWHRDIVTRLLQQILGKHMIRSFDTDDRCRGSAAAWVACH